MKYFITFYSGEQKYKNAAERLINQCKKIELFDTFILYSDEDLKKDSEFWGIHSEFIEKNPRGYGYWLWKPYIIMKTMEKMNENDILLYADAGCEIDPHKKNAIIESIEIAKRDLILGSFTQTEKLWNKMDLINYLDMNKTNYMNTSQNQASAICFLKCEKTYNLVSDWYNIGCNYHFIDDSPSVDKNIVVFNEHRHDQSIFSLLTKKYGIYSKQTIAHSIYISRNLSGNPKFK
jgi:hypothetical protein